ncbi:hypothetical protein DRQ25_00805 [Candidatus Fermentibacteria bacterium]|nr:MAG: hypothetical protein DRQ25_00805 [Candidatus Fermentibacteria bacterium]
MSRPVRTIKLAECEVDIVTELTWGEKERCQNVLLSGAKVDSKGLKDFDASSLYEAKLFLMEIGIIEIRKGEVKSKFKKEWVENLSASDGDLLYDELDKLNKKKEA